MSSPVATGHQGRNALPEPRHERTNGGAGAHAAAIRVALADDRALVRQGLRMLLGSQEGIEVMPGGGDVSSLGQVAVHHPDVLVLDLGLPGRSAITAITRLRERAPDTQIVVLTGLREPTFAQRTGAAGALGFVAKESAERDLPQAVRAAARGEPFVSASVASGMDATRRSFAEDRLTAREIEVLRLIALGHTSAEVARMLALSPRTVETHRARIHKKLGLATRAELVSYALRRRLLRA
ncbi:MAG: response regulator transcription factor [Solirubrobacteraceae bacterium]|jgi:two-component system response regulator NreC